MTRLLKRRRNLLILTALCLVAALAASYGTALATNAAHDEAKKGLEAVEGEAEHAAAAEGHGRNLWYDLLYRFMNFVILVGVLVYLLRKPAKKFFKERTENIKNQLEELDAQKAEAQKQYEEVKAKLANLEDEVAKIVDEYVEEGKREKDAIIAQAERQAEHIQQQAEFAVEQQLKDAKESLKAEVAELCVKAAEELIKENFTEEDQKRFIKEFSEKSAEA